MFGVEGDWVGGGDREGTNGVLEIGAGSALGWWPSLKIGFVLHRRNGVHSTPYGLSLRRIGVFDFITPGGTLRQAQGRHGG